MGNITTIAIFIDPRALPVLVYRASKGGGTANELRAENLEVGRIPRVLI